MLLGEVKVVLGERLCLQAGVDIALKGKDRLAGILRRKVRMPVVETGGVQIRSLSLMLISLPICGAVSLRAMPISC